MLQQTRVETVIPYYERFLARFPDVASLARAPEADVLAAWSGLGYYSRARSLRQAAGLIAREHAGRLPEDPAALRSLPGIGPYTSAAIASIATTAPMPPWTARDPRAGADRGLKGGAMLLCPAWSGARAESLARGTGPSPAAGADVSGALVCLPRELVATSARPLRLRRARERKSKAILARTRAVRPRRDVLLIRARGNSGFWCRDRTTRRQAQAERDASYFAVS